MQRNSPKTKQKKKECHTPHKCTHNNHFSATVPLFVEPWTSKFVRSITKSWMLWKAAWQVTELKWTRSNSFKRSGPSRICVLKSRQLCSRCRGDTRHEFQWPQIWRDDVFLGECELIIIGWSFEHFKTKSSTTIELFMQQNFSQWLMVNLVSIFRRIKIH